MISVRMFSQSSDDLLIVMFDEGTQMIHDVILELFFSHMYVMSQYILQGSHRA